MFTLVDKVEIYETPNMKLFIVDAFTDKAFKGNPAAVVLLDQERDANWMQSVAAEINLSETAFIKPLRDNYYQLKWFTPKTEINLCGHATLASAHVLWRELHRHLESDIEFETKSGRLTTSQTGDKITLNFPAIDIQQTEIETDIQSFLNTEPIAIYRGNSDLMIVINDQDALYKLNTDESLIKSIDARGVIVTTIGSNTPYDFISRFFAPSVGVLEDPVTGSAHCILAPYWAKRLHKQHMTALQASTRGGILELSISGHRVLISGKAVTTIEGKLNV